MAETGNGKTSVSSTLEQDTKLLQEDGGIANFLKGGFDEVKAIWDAGTQWVGNTYDVYTNDDIQDGAAYSELNNVVDRKEKRLNSLSLDLSLTQEQVDFQTKEIEALYKAQEDTLLMQSIKGEDKLRKFNEARYGAFNGAGEVSDKQELMRRISLESDGIISKLDTKSKGRGILSNDELSYKDKVKEILGSELANFEINKRFAIADLQSINASKGAIVNTLSDFNEIIALQTTISRYALNGVNEGILDGDKLTDFIMKKIGKTKMNRAVELKNQMNIDLQARQSKANLEDGNYFMAAVEYTGLGGTLLAKHLKSGLGFLKDDKADFKGDFSGLQLSSESGLSYVLDYTLDNYDDMLANIIGSVASGGVLDKASDVIGATAAKLTRLDSLMKTTTTGKKILDSKALKGAKYFKREIVAGLGANQVVNVAMNDVNSEERMISDAIMDVAMSPIFDGIFSGLGYGKDSIAQSINNSQLLSDLMLNDKKLIDQFKKTAEDAGNPISDTEAKDLLASTQDYLKKTGSDYSNKDLFKFIDENKARLEEEGEILGGGMVLAMRSYHAKSGMDFNVDVTIHKERLRKGGVIDLSENTITAKDLKETFRKVESLTVKETAEETTRHLLNVMEVDRKVIDAFISENKTIVDAIHDSIVTAKAHVESVNKDGFITADASPLDAIEDLAASFDIIGRKAMGKSRMISVYRNKVVDGKSVFVTDLIKEDELSINGYKIFHQGTGKQEQVFLNDTLYNKIVNNTFSHNILTNELLTKGSATKGQGDNIVEIKENLNQIFNIDIDDTNSPVKLIVDGNKYRLSFEATRSIVTEQTNGKPFTYNNKQVLINTNTINTILTDLLLNRADTYSSAVDFEDAVSGNKIKLMRLVKEKGSFSHQFKTGSMEDGHTIARQNVQKIIKGSFSADQLDDFNALIDNTLLNNKGLNKLRQISSLGKKSPMETYGVLTESLMFRAAERYSNADIRKLIDEVNADKIVSNVNKQATITDLLLGTDPINAFEHMGRTNSWHIGEGKLKQLGIKPTSDIFKLNKEQIDKFIDLMVKNKTGLVDDAAKKIFKEELTTTFNNNVETAVTLFSDNVIRASMNPDGMVSKMADLKTNPKTNVDEPDYFTGIEKIFNSDDTLETIVPQLNDAISRIEDGTISANQFNKIQEVVDKVRKQQNIEKGDDTSSLTFVTENLDKLVHLVDKYVKLDFADGGNQLSKESQKGSDNLIRKGLNYIMNPYQKSQLKNIGVSKAIDSFINKNILGGLSDDQGMLSLTNKHLDQEANGGYSAEEYQADVASITDKIREFIYPGAANIKSFNTKDLKASIVKRDNVLKALMEEIGDHIKDNNKISILNADGVITSGAEKKAIVLESLSPASLMKTFQTRLTKKNFDGYEINFNKGGKPTKLEGIAEYRTMYDHFKNIGAKPLVMEGNSTKKMPNGNREHYRIANNLVGWINKNQHLYAGTNRQKLLETQIEELIKYQSGIDDFLVDGKVVTQIYHKAEEMLETDSYVPGFINMMNTGEKDSFGAVTEGFVEVEGKGLPNFIQFMEANDRKFTALIVEELNMQDVKIKGSDEVDLGKVAKRMATLTAESETLLPNSKIPVRNYILDEPHYIDAILEDSRFEGISREDILDGDQLTIQGQDFLIKYFSKELKGFKQSFNLNAGSEDFIFYNKAITDLLTTAYSDGVSFLHPDQIEFYSNFQGHIDPEGRFPIKMHHYGQEDNWNVLYKTNFNSYTDDMKDQMEKIAESDGYDFSSTRLIGSESEKLKTYDNDGFVQFIYKKGGDYVDSDGSVVDIKGLDKKSYSIKTEQQTVTINGTTHKIKGYVDTDTSFDKHASSEAESHSEANGITKQGDVRTHGLGSEFILRTKLKLIKDTTDAINSTFRLNKKLDAEVFSEFEDFANYVLNETGLSGSSLATVNSFLEGKLKELKNLIEKPKDEGLGFRSIMQPRLNIKTNNVPELISASDGNGGYVLKPNPAAKHRPLADDELAVSPSKFLKMQNKLMKIGDDYYVSSYRNPVPNTENMTLNRVVIDHSMRSEEDVAIGSWNVFINKQADFDGDHLNIVYINNPKYLESTKGKAQQFGGLGITLGTIMNIEDSRTSFTGEARAKRKALNDAMTAKIYATEDAASLQGDITKFIETWILEQASDANVEMFGGGIPQLRVQVDQIVKGGEEIVEKTIPSEVLESQGITNGTEQAIADEIDTLRKEGFLGETKEEALIFLTQNVKARLDPIIEESIGKVVDNKLLRFEELYYNHSSLADFKASMKELSPMTAEDKALARRLLKVKKQEAIKRDALTTKKQVTKVADNSKSKRKITLVQAFNGSINGKDNIGKVDSFIRTLDLVRKYGWEFNNAQSIVGNNPNDIATFKAEVQSKYRNGLMYSVRKNTARLKFLQEKESSGGKITSWETKELEALPISITQGTKDVDTLVNNVGATMNSTKYKSIAAKLEQQTLDAAHDVTKQLQEGWENELLDEIFEGNSSIANVLVSPISGHTSKVYNRIGESKVLRYGTEYAPGEYTDIDLALFGQHEDLYTTLRTEIKSIFDDLSSIERVKADKQFFGFNSSRNEQGILVKDFDTEGIGYRKVADNAVMKYRVKPGMETLMNDRNSIIEPGIHVVDVGFSWIDGVVSTWEKGATFPIYSVGDPVAFKVFMNTPQGKSLTLKGLDGEGNIINNESFNMSVQNYPFPGVTKKRGKDGKYRPQIKTVEDEVLFDAALKTHEIKASIDIEGTSHMTIGMYGELLVAKDNKLTIAIPTDGKAFKAKGFKAEVLKKFNTKSKKQEPYGWEISINTDLDKKETVIKGMIDTLNKYTTMSNVEMNALRLRNNLALDDNLLTRGQKLKLVFTHYLMRDKDLKTDEGQVLDTMADSMREQLETVIDEVSINSMTPEDKVILDDLQKNLPRGVTIHKLNNKIKIVTNEELPSTVPTEGGVYEINKSGTKDGEVSYDVINKKDSEAYTNIDKEVEKEVKRFHSDYSNRNYDLELNVGPSIDQFDTMADKLDGFIDNVGKYNNKIMSSKVLGVFKDLMIRNQELKNNATFDLYEGFNAVQKEYPKLEKIRRRQLDNYVFMAIYKSGGNPTKDNLELYSGKYTELESAYIVSVSEFIFNKPEKGGQTIAELFANYNIDLRKSLRKDKGEGEVIDINTRFTSSLIEDVVNLHHKTEKMAFYEEGIYDRTTFNIEYKKRMDAKNETVNIHDRDTMFDVIFEHELIQNDLLRRSVSLMRSSTFSTTLGALSWLTGAAGFTMGLMQIPSELMRLGSFSKHDYRALALTDTMEKYNILKSTGIEAGIHFGPIEANPSLTHAVIHKAFSLNSETLRDNLTIKKASALASNPLIITDLMVDSARKRTAFGNMIHMLGFKSTEDFASKLDTMSGNERTDFLNRIRLGAELNYHELSGGVTAGSYLFRETTFARMHSMIPFSYLMNWALHTMSTTYGSAKQSVDGMRLITKGDFKGGMKLINDSNAFSRIFGQSLVAAGLYAKLHSYDEYDGEFKTRKDLNGFVKTLNANILALEMFYPVKAIERGMAQEGGLTAKLAVTLGAVSNSAFRELDLIGMIAEEAWTSHKVPGYSVWEAITTGLLAKGAKGLAFNKMIEVENQYPEFTRRTQIDQMFGADNPNFDEQFYKDIYSKVKGEKLDALWESGNGHLLFGEIMGAMPIIRHLSNLADGGTTYSYFDKQVRAINEKLTSGFYDEDYKDPKSMLLKLYSNGDGDRIWNYTKGFATKFGELDFKDKELLDTKLSKFIPEIKFSSYGQLTESIMVGEALNELGVEGYLRSITSGTNSENNRYIKQLLTKIQLNSPAKLPYVLSILLQSEEYTNKKAIQKAGYEYEGTIESQTQLALLIKYKDLIKGNNPMMAQLLGYTIMNDNPEFRDTMMSDDGYLSQTIADRVTTRLIMTQASEAGKNHAMMIGSRMGTVTNSLTKEFANGNISEGIFKSSILDIYRTASEEIQEGDFTPDQKLEIKTTLYKSLGNHAYVLYEDPKLGQAYEAARINLAHKLYQDSAIISKYLNDAQVAGAKWDITNPYVKKGYTSAYSKSNTYRPPSSGGGSKSYGNGYLQNAANGIQKMLGHPKTNFGKIFKPSYNPYAGEKTNPHGFRFTPEDNRIAIEYFRHAAASQFSRDLFVKKDYKRASDVFRTSRRKAELTKQDRKNVGRQQFRGFMSKGLLRGQPGSKEG